VQLEQELVGFNHNLDSLITIGVFDGVHLGHKYLISQLKQLAQEQGFQSVVITFDRHPQEVLTPLNHPPFLIDISEKTSLLNNEGVDSVIVLTFTRGLANYSAKDFLNLLKSKLHMRGLVIGPDFALGRHNEGNIETIRRFSHEMNFSVTVIPPATIGNEIISSTSIRNALAEGNMDKVQRLLGRPFDLHGQVIHGKGRGTGLGFPTINLNILSGQALPEDGVYATRVYIKGKTYKCVTNIGYNPTFTNTERSVETFILNYHNNLYQEEVKIEFIQKIRDETRFANIEDLKKQISKDIEKTEIILG